MMNSSQRYLSKTMGLFLMAAMLVHGLETVPLTYKTGINPKTCCGRPVCRCTHKKGAFCPFKNGKLRLGQHNHEHHSDALQATAPAPPSHHKSCHLGKSSLKNEAAVKAQLDASSSRPRQELPFLTQAPCSSKKGKAAGPSYEKEFFLTGHSHGPPLLKVSDAFQQQFFALNLLEDLRLDKPPQQPLLPLALAA